MERHYPNYNITEISEWEIIRETPFSSSNYVKTAAGEFIVDIHYTPAEIVTVTIAHNGYLSKTTLDPILEYCGHLAHTRGNYNIINISFVGSNEIGFGNYTIGEDK